jgi:FdhE protein
METDLERYAQAYPHYRTALGTLQLILDFQAAQAETFEPGPPMPLQIAHERWQSGLPLISGESLSISQSQLYNALVALRAVLPAGEDARETLERLLASEYVDAARSEFLLFDAGNDIGDRIQEMAASLPAASDVLAGLFHMVLTPFYQQQAMAYRPWVETAVWRHGFCPICGSEPHMARLTREEGRRILICSMCASEWSFDRLRCPFCEDDSQPHLRHFTVDDDPAHRVDCCDRCQRYIKTIDQRLLDSQVSFPAEDVITAHLDTLAQEQGYR